MLYVLYVQLNNKGKLYNIMVTFTFLAVKYVIIILTLSYSFLSLREGLEGGWGHQMITKSSRSHMEVILILVVVQFYLQFPTYTSCDNISIYLKQSGTLLIHGMHLLGLVQLLAFLKYIQGKQTPYKPFIQFWFKEPKYTVQYHTL